MRIPDPDGIWAADPDDDRIMLRDPEMQRAGLRFSTMREGVDNDGDGQVNEDGSAGST